EIKWGTMTLCGVNNNGDTPKIQFVAMPLHRTAINQSVIHSSQYVLRMQQTGSADAFEDDFSHLLDASVVSPPDEISTINKKRKKEKIKTTIEDYYAASPSITNQPIKVRRWTYRLLLNIIAKSLN